MKRERSGKVCIRERGATVTSHLLNIMLLTNTMKKHWGSRFTHKTWWRQQSGEFELSRSLIPVHLHWLAFRVLGVGHQRFSLAPLQFISLGCHKKIHSPLSPIKPHHSAPWVLSASTSVFCPHKKQQERVIVIATLHASFLLRKEHDNNYVGLTLVWLHQRQRIYHLFKKN